MRPPREGKFSHPGGKRLPNPTGIRPQNQAIWAVIILGFAAFGLSWFLMPPVSSLLLPLALFFGLVLAAEWVPVPVGEHGVQISVSLPIVVAVAAVFGPADAAIIDGGATLVAGILAVRSKFRTRWQWPLFNAAQSAMSASVAGMAVLPITHSMGGASGIALATLVATPVYLIVNSVIVAIAESVVYGGRFLARLQEKRRLVGFHYGVYALLATWIGLLAYFGQYWACAFFFLPMAAARRCFLLRARHDRDYRETIRALGLMMQHAHPYTGGHLDRVARFAALTAERLGLSSQDVDLMFDAALLHDLGKIAIDEQILNKPGRLDEQEWALVRMHPVIGAEILSRVGMMEPVVPWIYAHHERPDGNGYPKALSDTEIPIQAKIIAVADAFDAMVGGDRPGEQRPYRVSMGVEQAMRELHDCAGKQFDERVVMAFTQIVREQGAA